MRTQIFIKTVTGGLLSIGALALPACESTGHRTTTAMSDDGGGVPEALTGDTGMGADGAAAAPMRAPSESRADRGVRFVPHSKGMNWGQPVRGR